MLPSQLLNTPTASLQRGNPPNECPGYDTKQSDGVYWVPHSYVLVPPMFSNESNKQETYTYVRI